MRYGQHGGYTPAEQQRRERLRLEAADRFAAGDGTGAIRGVEGRGVARNKSTARDLGGYVCFEDEAGQGLRPPKGRTWAPRGARPVVKVRGAGGGRVSVAGVVRYRPGERPRLFYQLRAYDLMAGCLAATGLTIEA